MADALQILLITFSIPLIIALIVHTVRHARELDRRIAEYREEQESQTGPVNPYEQMAELYRIEGNDLDKTNYPKRVGPEDQSER